MFNFSEWKGIVFRITLAFLKMQSGLQIELIHSTLRILNWMSKSIFSKSILFFPISLIFYYVNISIFHNLEICSSGKALLPIVLCHVVRGAQSVVSPVESQKHISCKGHLVLIWRRKLRNNWIVFYSFFVEQVVICIMQ